MTQPGMPRFLANTPTDQMFGSALGLGQRVSSFRYEVINGLTGVRVGEVTPLRSTIPVLTHNTQNTIMRTLTGFNLGVADTAAMNPVTDRIKVTMVVAGPEGDIEFPLGRYMYSSASRQVLSGGDLAQSSLYDEMFIVDQQMVNPFGVTAGGSSAVSLIEQLLGPLVDAGLIRYTLQGTPGAVHGTWPAGTSRAKILSDICAQTSLFAPWFDNTGTMRIIDSFNPADIEAEFDFDDSHVVFRDSISYTNDFLSAPNLYIVTNTSGTSTATTLSGSYRIPASAPWSIENRGFVIPKFVDMQTADSGNLNAVAQTYAEQNNIFERTQLSTAPDPRHDSYNVIRWQDANWLEIAYSFQLQEGSPTIRTLRKAYR